MQIDKEFGFIVPSQTYGRKGVVINDYGSLDSHKTSLSEWTMSNMVKYRAALWPFLNLTALVFYHV